MDENELLKQEIKRQNDWNKRLNRRLNVATTERDNLKREVERLEKRIRKYANRT